MITQMQMYWLTRCDGILELITMWSSLLWVLGFCILFLSILFICFSIFSGNGLLDMFPGKSEEELNSIHSKQRKIGIRFLYVTALLVFINISITTVRALVPSTKELAAIVVVPRIANSQTVREIGQDVVELAKDWIVELRPGKGNETK